MPAVSIVSTLEQRYGKMTRARLHSVVTVVDADALASELAATGGHASQAAVSQLECADVVLLNKQDIVDADQLSR